MTSLRIAICQPSVPHYRGPLFNLLGKQAGVELTLFADEGGVAKWQAAVPQDYHHLLAPVRHYPGGLMFQRAMIEAIDADEFDLVILPWNVRYLSLWPALRRAKLTKVPVVLWGHGVSKHPNWLTDAIRVRAGRTADGVLLYTRTIAEQLIRRYSFDATRVFVAANAIDQAPINRAKEVWLSEPGKLRRFQQQNDLDPDYSAIFVSRLIAENRTDILLAAFTHVRRSHPRAKLVIVGEGESRPAMQAQAAKAGISEAVIFLGSIYDEMSLAPWMLSAALMCYPVNMGLSLLHAFGYGLPVLTSNRLQLHGPEIEALEPAVNGCFYRHGDTLDFAAKWSALLSDRIRRRTLSLGALETVRDEYNIQNMVRGFLRVAELAKNSAKNRYKRG